MSNKEVIVEKCMINLREAKKIKDKSGNDVLDFNIGFIDAIEIILKDIL